MAREIVLSNGELFVGLNNYGEVHDFYFPYVGQENHAAAKNLRHHVGVFVDGQISWLDDGKWQIKCRYHDDAMVGHIVAHQSELQVSLEFDDCVDVSQAAFLRNIHVINQATDKRTIKLYLHQAFVISNSLDGDTAQYIPDKQAILHYKGHRAFVCSGRTPAGQAFSEYSVGLHGIEGRDGTWRDAEDGQLSCNAVEHGRVDSIFGFTLDIARHSSARVLFWVAAGTSQREAFKIHDRLEKNGLLAYQNRTAKHWQDWLAVAQPTINRLDRTEKNRFLTSLLVIKAHQDKRGAIIASGDTTMLNYARDAYAYCWPRDGALALWPLLRLGYKDELIQFFSFIRRSLDSERGYLMHKYQADGSIGSSWQSYVHGQVSAPPIQADETAIVVFLFGRYIDQHPDDKLLKDFYWTMIKPMADFLASHLRSDGLPKPSYNLWEEVFEINTYTTAVTQAALDEAADLADRLNETKDAVAYRSAAESIRSASDRLWNQEAGYFYRGFYVNGDQLKPDLTIDISSFYGAFMFGLNDTHDDRLETAFETLQNKLILSDSSCPRYLGDNYNRQSADTPSNPWIITSLWLAEYSLETDKPELVERIATWLNDRFSPSGMLAEQYLAGSLSPTSVSPLVWSHAENLSFTLDKLEA